MQKILKNLVKLSILIYLVMVAILYIYQRDLLFFPQPKKNHTFKEMILKQKDEKIDVLVINQNKSNAILYFGGNAEDISQTAPNFKKNFPNHTIYMLYYPQYGNSKGELSQKNIFDNALFLYNKIKAKHKTISTIGRSLGTGVAIYTASKKDIKNLVLITPYDSITNVAQGRYPIFPIPLLIKDPFNSLQYVANINIKSNILVFLASSDKVVPHKYANNLIKHLNKDKTIVKTIANTTHGTIINNQLMYKNILDFLDKE